MPTTQKQTLSANKRQILIVDDEQINSMMLGANLENEYEVLYASDGRKALELMRAHGPDSRIGLITAVMLGSTETTFYTISVYFGAAKIRRTRYAVPAALIADLTGFLASALTVRLFFP